MIEIETPMCTVCGLTSKMFVDETAYKSWKSRETLIQQAFPNMEIGIRETLISGVHPNCWNILFGNEGYDDQY